MYFDTLKVSTLEQQASETSARGGLGNPHLITWNFDKEITVTLEDALYSPASQSLMQGGLFGLGKQKIYGAWDPYIYEKDRYGKSIYVNKIVITQNEYNQKTLEEQKLYIPFICPCDGEKKYVTYSPAQGKYKYASENEDIIESGPYKGCFKGESYKTNNYTKYKDKEIIENSYKPSVYTCEYMMKHRVRPEKAELIFDTFGNFDYQVLHYDLKDDNVEATYVDLCNKAYGLKSKNCNEPDIEELQYTWQDTDIKMISLEGEQDIYYNKNINIRYRMPVDQASKTIMASQRRLYNSEGTEIKYYTNTDLKRNANSGLEWKYEPYDSKINFYINWKDTLLNEKNEEVHYFIRVLVGTFYIIESLNYQGNLEDVIHPLDYGIKDVNYLERMEKCIATQTFCINADRNLRMEQMRQLPQYNTNELTVFINPKTMKPYEANLDHFHRRNGEIVEGNLCLIKEDQIYYKWTRRRAPKYKSLGRQIIVDAKHFPGAFRLVGETYARARDDGQDQRYQFEIPLCKLNSNTSLTLEAAGDPTTFNMTFNVLQREDGVMMKLTQYDVEQARYDGYCSGSHEVVPMDALFIENECPEVDLEATLVRIEVLSPLSNSVYCVPGDCLEPYGDEKGHGKKPPTIVPQNLESEPDRDKLIVLGHFSDGSTRILTSDEYEAEIKYTTGG